MLVLVCVAVALAVTSLTRRRLSGVLAIPWRHRWLLPLALVAQTVVVEVPGLPAAVASAVHVLTYALAGAFLLLNRHVKGLWLLGLGAGANAVTITLNGGTLPADPHALAVAGIRQDLAFPNSGPLAHPVLPWLGDVFAVPQGVPFANVFSVGDVLVVAGVVWLVRATGRRPRHRARPAPKVPMPRRAPDARPGAVDVLPGRSTTVPAAPPAGG